MLSVDSIQPKRYVFYRCSLPSIIVSTTIIT